MFVTDKETQGYVPTYREMAEAIGPAAKVCELGVFQGGSLSMWQEFFPDGLVVGVDNDPQSVWPEGSVKIVDSQVASALPGQLSELSPEGYDLIVDDASHDGSLTRQSWEMLWHLVKPRGWYVIEDWFVGLDSPASIVRADNLPMLRTAESFLQFFARGGDNRGIESVLYKYGLIVIRKGS
jgi:hypothetical protein